MRKVIKAGSRINAGWEAEYNQSYLAEKITELHSMVNELDTCAKLAYQKNIGDEAGNILEAVSAQVDRATKKIDRLVGRNY